MGYDYELSKGLAEKMGKRLVVKVAKSNEELISMLGDSADVLAFPVVIKKANKEKMDLDEEEVQQTETGCARPYRQKNHCGAGIKISPPSAQP